MTNRAYGVDEWLAMLQQAGWQPEDGVGIRLFSDHAPEDLGAERYTALLELARDAGRLDPYRRLARLIHVVARATGNPASLR